VKIEADSNDITECSHDDKWPTVGVFGFSLFGLISVIFVLMEVCTVVVTHILFEICFLFVRTTFLCLCLVLLLGFSVEAIDMWTYVIVISIADMT